MPFCSETFCTLLACLYRIRLAGLKWIFTFQPRIDPSNRYKNGVWKWAVISTQFMYWSQCQRKDRH